MLYIILSYRHTQSILLQDSLIFLIGFKKAAVTLLKYAAFGVVSGCERDHNFNLPAQHIPIDIHLIYNPSDTHTAACDITFCINCWTMKLNTQSHYYKAMWKPQTSITTQRSIVHLQQFLEATEIQKVENCKVTLLSTHKGEFNWISVIDFTNGTNIQHQSSRYPIISMNCELNPYIGQYHIRIRTISKDRKTLYIPQIKNDTRKNVYLMDRHASYILPHVTKTKPTMIYISVKQKSYFWLTDDIEVYQSKNKSLCFPDAKLIIKQALDSCKKEDSTKDIPYYVVSYRVTDVINIPFVAGYPSCYIQVQVFRPNLQPGCNLKLVFEKAIWENDHWVNSSVTQERKNTNTFATAYFHHSKYKWYTVATTWQNAETICTKDGGHLITINSHEELVFILNCKIKKTNVCLSPMIFIGLILNSNTHMPQWKDNRTMSINYWKNRNSHWPLREVFKSKEIGKLDLFKFTKQNISPKELQTCSAMFINFKTQISWEPISCNQNFMYIATFICEYKNKNINLDIMLQKHCHIHSCLKVVINNTEVHHSYFDISSLLCSRTDCRFDLIARPPMA